MKKFRIIYIPFGREDKEWMHVRANSLEEAMKNFIAGSIIRIEEEDDDED